MCMHACMHCSSRQITYILCIQICYVNMMNFICKTVSSVAHTRLQNALSKLNLHMRRRGTTCQEKDLVLVTTDVSESQYSAKIHLLPLLCPQTWHKRRKQEAALLTASKKKQVFLLWLITNSYIRKSFYKHCGALKQDSQTLIADFQSTQIEQVPCSTVLSVARQKNASTLIGDEGHLKQVHTLCYYFLPFCSDIECYAVWNGCMNSCVPVQFKAILLPICLQQATVSCRPSAECKT